MDTEYRVRISTNDMSHTEAKTTDPRAAGSEFRQAKSRYPDNVVSLEKRQVEPWQTVEAFGPPEMVEKLRYRIQKSI
jgi:hypothetical protein